MNPSLDKALYYLTGNGDIEDVAIEDLERLTNEFPFFTIGQLLLAKKLKLKNNPAFQAQLQKTALYISNPYWLHYQLLNYPPSDLAIIATEKPLEPKQVVIERVPPPLPVQDVPGHLPTTAASPDFVEELMARQEMKEPQEPALEPAQESIAFTSEDEEKKGTNGSEIDASIEDVEATATPVVNHIEDRTREKRSEDEDDETAAEKFVVEKPVPITTEFTQDEIEAVSDLAHEHLATDDEVPPLDAEVPITTEFTQEEIEAASDLAHEHLATDDEVPPLDAEVPITTEFTQDEIEAASDLAHQLLSTDDEPLAGEASTDQPIDKQDAGIIEPAAPFISEFEPTVEPFEKTGIATTQADEEMAAITREPDPATETFIESIDTIKERETDETPQVEPLEEPDEHELMFQNIKAMLDATTDETAKGVEGAVIPIDPYHTVDYFASQGIKLDLEPNPQDKLGKQVKKFTQWLKHMKKLGPEDAIDRLEDPEAEAEVQQSADTSNTVREVVTEAMAQVLEKQGKTAKAVELYNKLSFLNPHKSAYFADKIKKLKAS